MSDFNTLISHGLKKNIESLGKGFEHFLILLLKLLKFCRNRSPDAFSTAPDAQNIPKYTNNLILEDLFKKICKL